MNPEFPMRPLHLCLAILCCSTGACRGGDNAREAQSASDSAREAQSADSAQAKQQTYAECMAAANQQPSQIENVRKARECMRLPDAPPPGSTLPPGTPPPPGAGKGEAGSR